MFFKIKKFQKFISSCLLVLLERIWQKYVHIRLLLLLMVIK